jgi:hypothetical protein
MTTYIAVLDICCSPAKIRCSSVGHTMLDGCNELNIMTDGFIKKKSAINVFLLCP